MSSRPRLIAIMAANDNATLLRLVAPGSAIKLMPALSATPFRPSVLSANESSEETVTVRNDGTFETLVVEPTTYINLAMASTVDGRRDTGRWRIDHDHCHRIFCR